MLVWLLLFSFQNKKKLYWLQYSSLERFYVTTNNSAFIWKEPEFEFKRKNSLFVSPEFLIFPINFDRYAVIFKSCYFKVSLESNIKKFRPNVSFLTVHEFIVLFITLHDVNTLIQIQLVRFSYFFDKKHVVDADFVLTIWISDMFEDMTGDFR
jgi:hypothetical protein